MIGPIPYLLHTARQVPWIGMVAVVYVVSVLAGSAHPLLHLEHHTDQGIAVDVAGHAPKIDGVAIHHDAHQTARCAICATLSRTAALAVVPSAPPIVETPKQADCFVPVPPCWITLHTVVPRGPPVQV